MRKRWAWILLGTGVLATCFFAIYKTSPPLPTVRLADGRLIRVLKTGFGTNHVYSAEPLWKQALRKALPAALEKQLGRPKDYKSRAEYNSLAVYFDPLPSLNATQKSMMRVEVLFPDGTAYPRGSTMSWGFSSPYPRVLENYPRGEKELTLRVWDGTHPLDIKVPNPHPIRREAWTPQPLPQTNRVGDAELILKGWRGSSEPLLIARSSRGAPLGWMQWRTTLFDPLGNWDHSGFPGAHSEKVFKLLVEPTEYISAGLIEPPISEQYQTLSPNGVRTNWGVRFAALLGPGIYEISKSFDITVKRQGSVITNTLKALGSSWLVQCAEPAALSISERAVFEVRVRERLPDNKGRVFYGRPTGTAAIGVLIGQLFTPRLVAVTTNLEAEVVVRWPTVEFFVEKPK